jgi:anaerobic magnesium-protoporphyrin IX monomethyl ester cyclase
MKVCLTNPPWTETGRSGIRSGSRVPNIISGMEHTFIPFPFPLAYTASYLESKGLEVLLIDGIAGEISRDEYFRRIADFKPDLIINEISTASYYADLGWIRALRAECGARIAVCGTHPSALPGETLADCPDIDAVIVGEMEETALELSRELGRPESWAKIDGLAFRSASGVPAVNKRRKLIADIDALPYPRRSGLPMDKYCVAGFAPTALFMYASRGCPYLCNFCLWPQTIYGRGSVRLRKPAAVVEEIRSVMSSEGPFNSIYFDDDTFNIGRERMFEFADAMKTLPAPVPWGCNARPDLFDREILTALKAAGLFSIRIGIESGDPEVLNRVRKNLDLNDVRRCIDLAHDCGIAVHASYTIGLSGESWESVKKTVAFAKSISPDSVAFTVTSPYPGTAYHDEVAAQGFIETRDWSKYNGIDHAVFRTTSLSAEEIVEAEKYVMRKVYYTPSYVLRRFRYASNLGEIATLARKGLRLFFQR